MGKKHYEQISQKAIEAQRKELNRLEKKVKIPCPHTNSKGKLRVNFLSDKVVKCRICGAKFNIETIPMDTLDAAIRVVHDAINQTKSFSPDPKKEKDIITDLGEIDYNLGELRTLYENVTEQYGKGNRNKGKKKKHHNNNDFGAWGVNNVGVSKRR